MKQNLWFIMVLALCAGTMNLTGCASIVSSGSQEVTFKSVPDGATIIISGREMGKTPYTSKIDRKADQSVELKKDGYKTETFPLATTLNGWFFGNIIFGGFLGSTTDSISGAITEYSPSIYQITLTPISQTSLDTTSQRENEVRTFVVINYVNITKELSSDTNDTPYLSALWSLSKVQASKQKEAGQKLKELASANKDISDFAKQVAIELLVKQP